MERKEEMASSLQSVGACMRHLSISPAVNEAVKTIPGVYKSLSSVLAILNDFKMEKPVEELLSIYKNVESTSAGKAATKAGTRYPLVVLEGLDGAGKSLMTKLVSKRLNGIKMSTPPEAIKHLRPHFDQEDVDKVLRRAFYALGNYIAAHQISSTLHKSPVVLDRFWHSTAAYAIAELKDPEVVTDDVFTWPEDLLKPDLAVFLTVSEEVRLERMSRRKTYTAEEDQLKENADYRKLLTQTFLKMNSPSLKSVSCEGIPKANAQNIISLLNKGWKGSRCW